MTDQYIQAAIPSSYQIRLDQLLCQECGHQFECMTALDNVLVKFVDSISGEERWLPTFEKDGYLDLMTYLVPSASPEKEISMKESIVFQDRFVELQEKPTSGGEFRFAIGCMCPKCGSRNQKLRGEHVLDNPPLKWVRYIKKSCP